MKKVIRIWNASNRVRLHVDKEFHSNQLAAMDSLIDRGIATKEQVGSRNDSVNKLAEINNREAIDVSQKAKVKWTVEGDENSKFFHGVLKKKHRQMDITCVLKDGN